MKASGKHPHPGPCAYSLILTLILALKAENMPYPLPTSLETEFFQHRPSAAMNPPQYGTSSTNRSVQVDFADPSRTEIRVALTSHKDPFDVRRLTLTPNEPTIIGRASRSETKNLQPSPDNALFDCPVVSRTHAELRASPWEVFKDQVSITDKGSRHGTRINGKMLDPDVPWSLRPGDLIQFGDKVQRDMGMLRTCRPSQPCSQANCRDAETHEGILFAFDRIPSDTQASNTLTASHSARTYHVPDPSDDEDSDPPSDDEAMSIASDNAEDLSSAKTTPEQAKAKLGSQQQPIQLDSLPGPSSRHAIPIEDDDDDDFDMVQVISSNRAPKYSAVEVVQDSVVKDADVLAPESLRRCEPRTVSIESEEEECVHVNNTGLTGLLNGEGYEASEPDEDYENSEASDELDYPQDDDDDAHDEDRDSLIDPADDVQDRYEDNASDRSSEVDPMSPSEDELDDEEPAFQSYNRQPSPELESPTFAMEAPATTAAPIYSMPSVAKVAAWSPQRTASQPQYDPVRGSQPPKPFTVGAEQAAGIQPQSSHTYVTAHFLPYIGTDIVHVIDRNCRNRWDVPPPPPMFPYASYPATSSFCSPYPYQFAADEAESWQDHPTSRLQSILDAPTYQHWGANYGVWADRQAASSNFYTARDPRPYAPKAPEPQASSQTAAPKPFVSLNGKIGISDIVEGTATGEQLEPMQSPRSPKPATQSTIGSKRKAAEISGNTDVDLSRLLVDKPAITEVPISGVTTSKATEAPTESQASPAKARKTTDTAARVATETAKFAGAAAVGTVGTIAFLCSPLAERLIQWLS